MHHNVGVRRHPLVITLIGAAVLVASCTSREAAAPSISSASESSTSSSSTTSTTTSTPTTEAPNITDPAETAPTVEAATTDPPLATTPPPSGRPTARPTELFAGGDADGWLYVGRWTGSAWEQPTSDDGTPREPALTNNTEMFIHELDLEPIGGTSGAAASACTDGVVGPIISPNARAPEDPGFGYRSLAFAADWPTVPRPVALVDASIDQYLTSGQTAFSDTGIDTSSGKIEQLLVTDLDGDGDSESLVAFTGTAFAALLLIDADSGTGLTVARSIAETSTPTTIAGAEATAATFGPFETFRTLAIADVNGDGLAEFVVHSWERERDATVTVYTYDGRDVTSVLNGSC